MTDIKQLVAHDWVPDKTKFKDAKGRYITQSLFLEVDYKPELSVYTLKDADFEYAGVIYPSLRRLFLEEEDPTGYYFSQKYLWGWEHWKRILENKLLAQYIDDWYDELEVRLRAKGIIAAIKLGAGNLASAKWLADGKWREASKGRPSAAQKQKERLLREAAMDEASKDASRVLELVPRKRNG